jgi:hypothetical protein
MRVIVVTVVVVSLAAVLVGSLSAGEESSSKWLLYPSSNEADNEMQVARYLKAKSDVEAKVHQNKGNSDDIYISYKLSPDGAPEIRAFVDTAVSTRNSEGAVTERMFRVHAYYVLPDSAKTPQIRGRLLEFCNRWHASRWWPSRVYLDKDGDIVLESTVNIPGLETPIHAESVNDLLQRMLSAWKELHPEILKAAGLAGG